MPREKPLPRGIRRERHGFRAYVRVHGELRVKRFPADTTIDKMLEWREREQAHTVLRIIERPNKGTLAADAATYLQIVSGMPTLKTRQTQIHLWVQALGAGRDRRDITSAEIAAQLAAWQRVHHWAPGTLNRHRTALSHFYRTLNGPKDLNPVASVPKSREPEPAPRGLDYRIVQAILDAMPGRDLVKPGKGERRYAPSRARAMLRVMAYVGMPPAQIRQLQPEHIDWKTKTITMPGRQKGAGTAPRRRALTDQGVEALKEFAAADAWGGVAKSTLRLVFNRAVKIARRKHRRLRIPVGIRPYDLRHSFAELVYRTTRSLNVTAGLLGHLDERTTRRYIGGAVAGVERAAAIDVSAALGKAKGG